MFKTITGAALVALSSSFALAQTAQAPVTEQAALLISMADAIKAAQERLPGGVWAAEVETRGGRPVYEIDIVSNGKIHEVQVDARSGQVIGTEEEPMNSRFKQWFAEGKLKAAESSQGMLVRSLSEIERQVNGRAVEVELERENDRLVYEVELQTAQGSREIYIDAATGENLARTR